MTTEILYCYTDDTISNKQIEGKKLYLKKYCKDGMLHREDGAAVEYANGDKEYWVKGKLHRLDGPAIEEADGTKEYWINNIDVTDKLKGIKEEDTPKYLRMLLL